MLQYRRVSRRAVIGTAAAGFALMVTPTGAVADTKHRLRLTLPAATGPVQVGVADLHLTDHSRPDPLRPGRPYRELMVSVFYPAESAQFYVRAPHMLPGAAAQWDLDIPGLGLPAGVVDWSATRTHAHLGAPVARSRCGHPVIMYSAGLNMPRTMGTILAADLAGRGYVVVSVDHTYEAMEVEFPGGRVERMRPPEENGPDAIRENLRIRVADLRFVLDRLTGPGAAEERVPRGLPGALDLTRVGVFGHSLGGATAAQVMHDDGRFAAGIDLDGWLLMPDGPLGTVAEDGLDRPFLIMDSDIGDHTHPGMAPFWEQLRGWRLNLQLVGAQHHAYTDLQVLLPQIAAGAPSRLDEKTISSLIGTLDARRSVQAQAAYVAAFFDRMLRARHGHLLDGPSRRFPQVRFVP